MTELEEFKIELEKLIKNVESLNLQNLQKGGTILK